MRFASGVTDQVISFKAVDATDFVTPETGLTGFTVYRMRNGGTVTAYTTPTVTEVDATNMPGIYKLLLDEDMTIGAGNLTEEVVLHITKSGMAPVDLKYELWDPAALLAQAVETNFTLQDALRLMSAVLLGKASGLGTTEATFRDVNDTTNRVVATVDADGNRGAVTLDPD